MTYAECHAVPCAWEWWKVCWEQPAAVFGGDAREALETSCMGDETNICMDVLCIYIYIYRYRCNVM